jgi:hypothetical protein
MAALRRTRRLVTVTALTLLFGSTALTHASAPPETTSPGSTDTTAPVDETSAGEAGAFAVQPSGEKGPGGRDFFVYTFPTGQQFGDRVAISNLSDATATYAVYATDAVNTDDGSFSLLREEEKPTDVGTWVELGATQYTLEPGQQVIIPFSITVPADATPGDHVGAIVAQKLDDPSDPNAGIGVDVRVRIGARIYVRVDGVTNPSLSVDSFDVTYDAPGTPFSGATAKVTYVLTNTGDVRLSPTADLKLAGLFGLGEEKLPQRAIPELVPGGSITISEVVKDVKPYVRLTADLAVTAEDGTVASGASITQWTVPWLSVGIIGAIIVGIVLWRIWARRRGNAAA